MVARERFAWIWLVGMALVGSCYFGAVKVLEWRGVGMTPLERIVLLATALGGLGAVALTAHLGLRWSRRDDVGPPDERDRAIEQRASSIAYYVLMAGTIVVGCVMPFETGGWKIVHGAILAIVLAEVVHHGLLVHGYRRGVRA